MPGKSKKREIPDPKKERERIKFIVYGEEMVERIVKTSGNSGRIYLPPNWVGCWVKIIRVD
jgi:putative transposon-encoded protein